MEVSLSHSKTLFVTRDGAPMRFYVRPGPHKRQLAPLIAHGGGVLCRVQEPGAFLLADPEEGALGPGYISTAYIHSCVSYNRSLSPRGYRLLPRTFQNVPKPPPSRARDGKTGHGESTAEQTSSKKHPDNVEDLRSGAPEDRAGAGKIGHGESTAEQTSSKKHPDNVAYTRSGAPEDRAGDKKTGHGSLGESTTEQASSKNHPDVVEDTGSGAPEDKGPRDASSFGTFEDSQCPQVSSTFVACGRKKRYRKSDASHDTSGGVDNNAHHESNTPDHLPCHAGPGAPHSTTRGKAYTSILPSPSTSMDANCRAVSDEHEGDPINTKTHHESNTPDHLLCTAGPGAPHSGTSSEDNASILTSPMDAHCRLVSGEHQSDPKKAHCESNIPDHLLCSPDPGVHPFTRILTSPSTSMDANCRAGSGEHPDDPPKIDHPVPAFHSSLMDTNYEEVAGGHKPDHQNIDEHQMVVDHQTSSNLARDHASYGEESPGYILSPIAPMDSNGKEVFRGDTELPRNLRGLGSNDVGTVATTGEGEAGRQPTLVRKVATKSVVDHGAPVIPVPRTSTPAPGAPCFAKASDVPAEYNNSIINDEGLCSSALKIKLRDRKRRSYVEDDRSPKAKQNRLENQLHVCDETQTTIHKWLSTRAPSLRMTTRIQSCMDEQRVSVSKRTIGDKPVPAQEMSVLEKQAVKHKRIPKKENESVTERTINREQRNNPQRTKSGEQRAVNEKATGREEGADQSPKSETQTAVAGHISPSPHTPPDELTRGATEELAMEDKKNQQMQCSNTISALRRGTAFTSEEDLAILIFVHDHHSASMTISGNRLWKLLEEKRVLGDRTWQSMRARYVKHLVNKKKKNKLPPKCISLLNKIYGVKSMDHSGGKQRGSSSSIGSPTLKHETSHSTNASHHESHSGFADVPQQVETTDQPDELARGATEELAMQDEEIQQVESAMVPQSSNIVSFLSSGRIAFTKEEDLAILNFVRDHHSTSMKATGNRLWKLLEEKRVLGGRTWQSMKARYVKHLVKKKYLNKYKLPPKCIPQLNKHYRSGGKQRCSSSSIGSPTIKHKTSHCTNASHQKSHSAFGDVPQQVDTTDHCASDTPQRSNATKSDLFDIPQSKHNSTFDIPQRKNISKKYLPSDTTQRSKEVQHGTLANTVQRSYVLQHESCDALQMSDGDLDGAYSDATESGHTRKNGASAETPRKNNKRYNGNATHSNVSTGTPQRSIEPQQCTSADKFQRIDEPHHSPSRRSNVLYKSSSSDALQTDGLQNCPYTDIPQETNATQTSASADPLGKSNIRNGSYISESNATEQDSSLEAPQRCYEPQHGTDISAQRGASNDAPQSSDLLQNSSSSDGTQICTSFDKPQKSNATQHSASEDNLGESNKQYYGASADTPHEHNDSEQGSTTVSTERSNGPRHGASVDTPRKYNKPQQCTSDDTPQKSNEPQHHANTDRPLKSSVTQLGTSFMPQRENEPQKSNVAQHGAPSSTPQQNCVGQHGAPSSTPQKSNLAQHGAPSSTPQKSNLAQHGAPSSTPQKSNPAQHGAPSSTPQKSNPAQHGAPSSTPQKSNPAQHGAPSSTPQKSNVAQHGAPSSTPQKSNVAQHGAPSSTPQKSNVAQHGAPSSTPQKSNVAQHGAPSSTPQKSNVAQQGAPSSTPQINKQHIGSSTNKLQNNNAAQNSTSSDTSERSIWQPSTSNHQAKDNATECSRSSATGMKSSDPKHDDASTSRKGNPMLSAPRSASSNQGEESECSEDLRIFDFANMEFEDDDNGISGQPAAVITQEEVPDDDNNISGQPAAVITQEGVPVSPKKDDGNSISGQPAAVITQEEVQNDVNSISGQSAAVITQEEVPVSSYDMPYVDETQCSPGPSESEGLQEAITDMMREFQLDVFSAMQALFFNNGEVGSTRHFLRIGQRPDGYPIWEPRDDSDLNKNDPKLQGRLIKKYGADNVAKRVAFLAS